jgi:hypothetical protein
MIFTKKIEAEKYLILFNGITGTEILSGINNNPDPFILDGPSMIDVGVMGHCSNNCKICYQGNINIPNMKLEDFKSIIDQCKDHINQVALGGKGDPNKHENFKEIMEYCRKNNVVPNYTTSGNGLTDEEVEITKKYAGAAAVSCYFQDFTYSTLNKFIKAGVKTNIHFVVSTETFPLAIRILNGEDIWEGKFPIDKLNAVIFLLFKPQGNGADKGYLCLSIEQINEFANLLMEPKAKFKIGCDSCMINKVSQVRKLTDNEKVFVDTCEGSRMSCYISPDMRFMPCSFGDKMKYGIPITETNPIKKIWKDGQSFQMFREILQNNPMTCPYEL